MAVTGYLGAFGRFIASYLFWIAILAATNVAVWAGLEWSWHSWPPTDLWAVRMYLASGLLLFDNLCILWWYAHTTRQLGLAAGRQAAAAEQQMAATEKQLTLAQQEYRDTWLERWRENKPVVFSQWGLDGNPEIKNAGAGMAVNVYVLAVDRNGAPRHEVLGVVRPGEVVRVRGNAEQLIRSPAHVLIAEGIASRTRRWNPTFNWQRQGGFEHKLAYPAEETIPEGVVSLPPESVDNLSVIGEEIMHPHRCTRGYPAIVPGARSVLLGYKSGLQALSGFFDEHAFFPFLEDLGLDPRAPIGARMVPTARALEAQIDEIHREGFTETWRVNLGAAYVQAPLMAPPSPDRDRLLALFDRPVLRQFRELGRTICAAIDLAVNQPPDQVETTTTSCVRDVLHLTDDAATVRRWF